MYPRHDNCYLNSHGPAIHVGGRACRQLTAGVHVLRIFYENVCFDVGFVGGLHAGRL